MLKYELIVQSHTETVPTLKFISCFLILSLRIVSYFCNINLKEKLIPNLIPTFLFTCDNLTIKVHGLYIYIYITYCAYQTNSNAITQLYLIFRLDILFFF